MTQDEQDRIVHQLKVAERERDKLAFRLVKSQDDVERLQDSVDRLSERMEKASRQGAMLDVIRQKLGPLVPTVDWRSVPLLVVVDAVVERAKS